MRNMDQGNKGKGDKNSNHNNHDEGKNAQQPNTTTKPKKSTLGKIISNVGNVIAQPFTSMLDQAKDNKKAQQQMQQSIGSNAQSDWERVMLFANQPPAPILQKGNSQKMGEGKNQKNLNESVNPKNQPMTPSSESKNQFKVTKDEKEVQSVRKVTLEEIKQIGGPPTSQPQLQKTQLSMNQKTDQANQDPGKHQTSFYQSAQPSQKYVPPMRSGEDAEDVEMQVVDETQNIQLNNETIISTNNQMQQIPIAHQIKNSDQINDQAQQIIIPIDTQMVSIKTGKEHFGHLERTIDIYCLYDFQHKYKDAKIQAVAQFQNYKHKPEYYTFKKVPLKFGDHTISVYHLKFPIFSQFTRKGFQLRVLDDTGTIKKDYDYYEFYDKFREYGQGEHHFVFDMKILPNHKFFSYSDPPGASIVDQFKQLFFFTNFLLHNDQQDLIPEMINQLRISMKASYISTQMSSEQHYQFSAYYKNILQTFDGNEINTILIQILGLLPQKNLILKFLEVSNSGNILELNLSGILQEMKTAIDSKLAEQGSNYSINNLLYGFSKNLKVQGFINAMLFNKYSEKKEWQKTLDILHEADASLYLLVIKLFLTRLNDNQIKIPFKIIFENLIKIKNLKDQVPFDPEEFQEIYLLLLEQPADLKSYIKLLGSIYSEEDQEEDKEISQLQTFDQRSKNKILDTINKFNAAFINDLSTVNAFVSQMKSYRGTGIASLFHQSNARQLCNGVFNNYKNVTNFTSDLQQSKQIFIDNYERQYIKEDHFEMTVKMLLNHYQSSFMEVFSQLLQPWGDFKLSLLYTTRYLFINEKRDQLIECVKWYLQNKIQRGEIAFTYIISFDDFIFSLQKLYQPNSTNQKNEREFFINLSTVAIDQFYNYTQLRTVPFVSSEFMVKFNNCKSTYFVNAYMEKVKHSYIDLNIKRAYDNPLDKLLQVDSTLEKERKDSKLVKELIDYAFGKTDDKLTEKNVMLTLITNPKIDHQWYRMIENSKRYSTQKQVSHITEIIHKIAQNLWNEQFSIQELLDLQNLSNVQKLAFVEYIRIVLDVKRKQNEAPLDKEAILGVIRSQIAEAQQVIQKITEVKSFLNDFSKLSKDTPLVKNFENYAKDYRQRRIADLRTFPPSLENFQNIASKIFTFQNSKIFNQYLQQTKVKNPELDETGQPDPEKVIANCERAFENMKNDIAKFLDADDTNFLNQDVQSIIKGAQLNEFQITNELEEIKKIFPGSKNHRMNELIGHLISFTQIPVYEQMCISTSNIARMQYTFKDPQRNQQSITTKIFALRLEQEVNVAQNFLEHCVENFVTTSVQDYKNSFNDTKKCITNRIEDSLRINGHFVPRQQRIEIEEVKNQEGQMMIQQQVYQQQEGPPRAKDPQQKIIAILSSFNDKSLDLFKFVRVLTKSELDLFRDYVNDYDDSGVNSQTILDLVQVWEFVQEIIRLGQVGFEGLIKFFVESLRNPLFKDMDDKIQKCITHLTAITNFKDEIDSKEQAKKKQVIEIMDRSTLIISPENLKNIDIINDTGFNIKLTYKKNKDEKVFDRAAISELRDRALLLYNTMSHSFTKKNQLSAEEQQRQDSEQKMMNGYVKFANLIEVIVKNLMLLQDSGFPKDHEIFQQKRIECEKSNFQELESYEQEIQLLLAGWEECLIKGYNTNYPLTFLCGQKIWILEGYLRGTETPNPENIIYAQNLLKYMGKRDPGLGSYAHYFLEKLQSEFIIQQVAFDHTYRFNKLCEILLTLEDIRGTDEDISVLVSDKSLDNSNKDFRKIVYKPGDILYLETQKHFVGIVSIFKNLNKNFPRSDQLFFCQEDTKWQEIQSFMYRCIKDPRKELHCIVKVEQLSLENQVKFTTLLQKFMKEEMPLDKFELAIIATNSFSHISDFIKSQDYKRIIKDTHLLRDQDIREIVQQIDTQTVFVSSKYAGLGKTHYIKNQGELLDYTIQFFPIAGKIDFKEIGQRLAKVEFIERKILAIQISFVDKIELLNELLIGIALFRTFVTSNYLFILPKHSSIYIEISNTFDNSFETSLFYKKFLNQQTQIHHIDHFDITSLQVINEPPTLNDLQRNKLLSVCHQLNMYKEMVQNNGQAIQNEEDFLVTMTNETCLIIIQEFFVEPQVQRQQEPNFIQLKVFEKMMFNLLNNLTMGIFSPQVLTFFEQDYKRAGFDNLAQATKNLKQTLFNAILITVREFTVRSINRSIQKRQNAALNQISQKMNEKLEQINTSSSVHQNQGPVEDEDPSSLIDLGPVQSNLDEEFKMTLSWESSNHFNVVIIQDGFVAFIYRDQNQVDLEMKRMISVQYSVAAAGQDPGRQNEVNKKIKEGNFNDIPDFSKMCDEELIQRLKQLKIHSQHLEITSDNYVVTADNYLKMCLIYLRVQSRVPVVIMGETGCGKTSLINFFCRNVLQDRLEIFNIHAGVTTKMIIERMQSYILTANYGLNEYQNLWIFFDEFNTSENLGLICEMLTDRKLLGESLPDNMILLAACNPYKLRSKKISFDENVGIKRSNARSRVAQNMLLYTVHPLPENVIESVWDFGALTDEDQKRYIHEMVTKAKVQKKNVEMITQMLVAAHRYFKRNEDSSSVSLRDVSRFIILYLWFAQSLREKKVIAQQFIECLFMFCVKYRFLDDFLDKHKEVEYFSLSFAQPTTSQKTSDIIQMQVVSSRCKFDALSQEISFNLHSIQLVQFLITFVLEKAHLICNFLCCFIQPFYRIMFRQRFLEILTCSLRECDQHGMQRTYSSVDNVRELSQHT